ncbi:MAG: hypothetical protein JXQ96_19280 [Cyclobacteriaceae bacterium]
MKVDVKKLNGIGGPKSEKAWRTRLFLNNINPKMIVVGEGFEPSRGG